MDRPDDSDSIGDGRAWLWAHLENGERCPLCHQYAKLYRRKLTAHIGRVLINMWRTGQRDWVYLAHIRSAGQDEAIARFWGLIEKKDDEAGFWRLTGLGILFVHKGAKVPKYAYIYNNHCQRLDWSEGEVDIVDVLGTKFDHGDLMRGI